VSVQADRERLVQAAVARFGRVDVLVNNAGISIARGQWWDAHDPLRVLDVNLVSPIELVRLVLPDMRARGSGHIVNIGSVAGRVPTHGMYSASKYGLRGFSLALRRELLGSGVDVSLVSPGFVRTPLTGGARSPCQDRRSWRAPWRRYSSGRAARWSRPARTVRSACWTPCCRAWAT